MIRHTFVGLTSVFALLLGPASGVAIASSTQASFLSFSTTRQLASGYTAAQLTTAYNIGPLAAQGIDGTGQTIALIEFDSFSQADLQHFDASNQLSDPTVQEFYVGGKTFSLPSGPETALDVEWAHAMAPGATIQIYYLNSNQANQAGWKSLAQGLNQAAANGAGTISMSFGACVASNGYKATKTALAGLLNRGISVFVSSGDTGAYPGPKKDCGTRIGVSYPASDPSVVSVGGTSLVLNNDNTIGSETAWRLAGGGKGAPLLHPVWQIIAQLSHPKYRWVPDVAFLADPRTGAEVYFKGAWHQAGGTSLGAPAWAGIWALVRQDLQQASKTAGAAPPLLYSIANSTSYSLAFHDITVGSNGYYTAAVGWDPVTGWGTPDVAGLATSVLDMSSSGP